MQASNVQKLSTLARGTVNLYLKRNIGVTSYIAQKVASDPIQKLFADKVKEYSQKSKSAGSKLFEASPQIEKAYKDELNRLEKQYGGGKGIDLTKFPTFNFKEPTIDPINMVEKK